MGVKRAPVNPAKPSNGSGLLWKRDSIPSELGGPGPNCPDILELERCLLTSKFALVPRNVGVLVHGKSPDGDSTMHLTRGLVSRRGGKRPEADVRTGEQSLEPNA